MREARGSGADSRDGFQLEVHRDRAERYPNLREPPKDQTHRLSQLLVQDRSSLLFDTPTEPECIAHSPVMTQP